jgi:CheY-like chemotaxis protein
MPNDIRFREAVRRICSGAEFTEPRNPHRGLLKALDGITFQDSENGGNRSGDRYRRRHGRRGRRSCAGTTSGMLEDLGYSVLSAETGGAALKIVQEDSRLDLVFSDVVMSDGMSGVDLARKVGLLRPGLPILLTSGYTAQRVLPKTATGEMALLKKPFSQAELSMAIRKLMVSGS